ncbi:APC family permease [Acidisoma silvae]|uniref:APC family permease n=1 Tax=Acidisoma silvae TaxID=2802396 RepID=A0A964E192_9PROT|nr:APC family permease [Acidisoma silvae]MCB8877979.1 APC family permease [Acidisoma silvae]
MTGLPRNADRLSRNQLGLPQIVASTLANIAPAVSFYFGFGLIVGGAGVAAPLTIIVAMIAILFLGNTLAEFSKYRPSTGSFVTFIGMGLGPTAGAAASIFTVIGYAVAAAAIVAISGGWAHDTIKLFLGINIPWQVLSILATGICAFLVSRGVKISTTWAAIFFYFELALLLIGAVAMLIVNWGSLSLAPFMPSHLSGGLAGIGLGFPLAVYSFVGWENSATLAEETADPRRNIPKALVAGTIAIGLVYIFLGYSTEIAFHNDAKAIGNSALPYIDAIKHSAPALLFIAYLAGVTSIFSCLLGLTNSQARILFSAGREGLLPRFFGKIHPQHKTPHVAMWAYIATALLITLLCWNLDPVTIFGDTGTLGTIPIIVVYLVTTLALPVYIIRFHREDFSIIRHAIIPAFGVLLTLFPLWGLVQPGQPAPFNIYPTAVAIGLLLAILYGIILARRKPDLVQRIGSYVADEEY